MTIPAYIITGRENALYSTYKAIQTQFSGWTGNLSTSALNIYPMSYNQTMGFPAITLNDIGGPSLGDMALGQTLAPGVQGFTQQSQIEINCYDMNLDPQDGTSGYPYAEQNVRRMTDLVEDFLMNAGQPGTSGSFIYPAISLVDGNNGNATTSSQVFYERQEPGSRTWTFIENTGEQINLKRYRGYFRMKWFQYSQG